MVKFLERDFSLKENRVAASKNAYVLLGQRRFELAATFFLLAGELLDAVNIIVKNLDDAQLAVAVVRIRGPAQSVTHESSREDFGLETYIDQHLIPFARDRGMGWRVTMLHLFRGRMLEAVDSILSDPLTESSAGYAALDAMLSIHDIPESISTFGVDRLMVSLSKARRWYECCHFPELALECCDCMIDVVLGTSDANVNVAACGATSTTVEGSVFACTVSRLMDQNIIMQLKAKRVPGMTLIERGCDEDVLTSLVDHAFTCVDVEDVRRRVGQLSAMMSDRPDGPMSGPNPGRDDDMSGGRSRTRTGTKGAVVTHTNTGQHTRDTGYEGAASHRNFELKATPIFSMQGEVLHAICACAQGEHIAVGTNNHGIVDASVLNRNPPDQQECFSDTVLRTILEPRTSVSGKSTLSYALAAHPYDMFYASGSHMRAGDHAGELMLWRFGSPNGEPEDALVTLADLTSRGSGTAPSQITGVCWSLSGARVGAIDGSGRAYITSPEASCRGSGHVIHLLNGQSVFSEIASSTSSICGITFSGSGGSVVACVGESSTGHNLQLIDALSPPHASRVLRCVCHDGGALAVATWNGFQMATGGRHGDVCLHDVRMIGDDVPPLWTSPNAHADAVESITFTNQWSSGGPLVASGGRDGDLRLTCLDGSEFHVVRNAHNNCALKHAGAQARRHSASHAAVTGLVETCDGLLSCGEDGQVKLWTTLGGEQ